MKTSKNGSLGESEGAIAQGIRWTRRRDGLLSLLGRWVAGCTGGRPEKYQGRGKGRSYKSHMRPARNINSWKYERLWNETNQLGIWFLKKALPSEAQKKKKKKKWRRNLKVNRGRDFTLGLSERVTWGTEEGPVLQGGGRVPADRTSQK